MLFSLHPVLEIALVVDVLSLTGRTLYGVGRQDVDVGLDTGKRYESVVKGLDKRHLLARVGREEFFTQLYIKVKGIFVALAVYCDKVLGCKGREFGKHCLYLAWEDIYATDDEHVVATPQHLTHPDGGTATLARLIVETGKVAGTVAQDRHCLFGK